MLKATLSKEGDKLLLQCAYNPVLTRLLNALPKKECFYRDETQIWYVDLKHEQTITAFLRRLGYLTTETDRPIPDGNDSFSVLGLLPTAIPEVCLAAYRALVKINHPDNHGNTETMQRINEAWEIVRLQKGLR